MEYGYCRISRKTMNIERQVRNILGVAPNVKLFLEAFTGTKVEGRKEFEKLCSIVKEGDVIYFDSVSRMSRNSEEGVRIYMQLMDRGVELRFLKEPHINTSTYKKAISDRIKMTGTHADILLEAINEYLKVLATEQIRICFDQAEKEVSDLRRRTVEGIETARINGKQIGGTKGRKLNVKKAMEAKKVILKHNKAFGGSLSDEETYKLAKISRPSYYKYKKELLQERKISIA